jgi:hypothetical protein
VGQCEHDHQASAGNDGGLFCARGVSLPRGSALGAPPTPDDWPRFPGYVVARRYAGLRHRAKLISASNLSNGADDSFTVQDHSQERACGASLLCTADP